MFDLPVIEQGDEVFCKLMCVVFVGLCLFLTFIRLVVRMFRFFLLLSSFMVSFFLQAGEASEHEFSGDQLKQIRSISQSILRVRGAERKIILADIEPLREEISQVEVALKNAVAVLDKPSIKFPTHSSTLTAPSLAFNDGSSPSSTFLVFKDRFLKRISAYWQDNIVKSKSARKTAVNNSANRHLEYMDNAKKILEKRRVYMEKNMPAFWEVWKDRNRSKDNVRIALMDLVNELEEIENANHRQRRSKLTRLIKRLEGSESKEKMDVIPTITSMTKHYRK